MSAGTRIAPAPWPGKIIGVGLNYADHAAQVGRAAPRRPQILFKAPSAVIGPGQAIMLPAESARVEHEAELALVIGQTIRRVAARDVLDAIAGYCCANDVTARDIQHADGLPDYAKSFDTFCPLGPVVPTSSIDVRDLRIECLVNGQMRQQARTSQMLTPIPELVAHICAASGHRAAESRRRGHRLHRGSGLPDQSRHGGGMPRQDFATLGAGLSHKLLIICLLACSPARLLACSPARSPRAESRGTGGNRTVSAGGGAGR